MWEIYSIGDAAFLESILNAVAMLAGTADLKQLAGVGFLLGVLLVLFQGILGGAYSIKFQNVLIAWVALRPDVRAQGDGGDRGRLLGGGAGGGQRAARPGRGRLDAVQRRLRRDPAVRDRVQHAGHDRPRLCRRPADPDDGPQERPVAHRPGQRQQPDRRRRRRALVRQLRRRLHPVRRRHRHPLDRGDPQDPELDHAAELPRRPDHRAVAGRGAAHPGLRRRLDPAAGLHHDAVRAGAAEKPAGRAAAHRAGGRPDQGAVRAGPDRRRGGRRPELHGDGGRGAVLREGRDPGPRGPAPLGAGRHGRAVGRPAERPVGGGAEPVQPQGPADADLLRGVPVRHRAAHGLCGRARARSASPWSASTC